MQVMIDADGRLQIPEALRQTTGLTGDVVELVPVDGGLTIRRPKATATAEPPKPKADDDLPPPEPGGRWVREHGFLSWESDDPTPITHEDSEAWRRREYAERAFRNEPHTEQDVQEFIRRSWPLSQT